jgi:hypothetical protein
MKRAGIDVPGPSTGIITKPKKQSIDVESNF